MTDKDYLELRKEIDEKNGIMQRYEYITFNINRMKDSLDCMAEFLNRKENERMLFNIKISNLEKTWIDVQLHGDDIRDVINMLISSAEENIKRLKDERDGL